MKSTVPAPARLGSTTVRGLQKAMRLAQNPKRFDDMTRHLRELSKRRLDESISFSQQDPETMKDFLNTVMKTYPFFRNYQDGWPIHAYLKRYLMARRYRLRVQGARKRGKAQNQHVKTENRRTQDKVSQRRSVRKPVSIGCNSEHEPAHVPSAPQKLSSIPSTNKPISPSTSNRSFRSFLQSFDPQATELVPDFIRAGIVNITCFRNMMKWPDAEWETLLKEDMKLEGY
ncbi:hypothetical protein AcV5_000588 [Taiwanofungus camphoratus]|nr:hypothetical protein AcV5_000588 [Antrodia cinnamomea]